MDKFWKWVRNKKTDKSQSNERTLYINGEIAHESWFDDDVTPALFKNELNSGNGDITLWINSPGGDCFAAASIYNMLRDYDGKVTVKIDGIAASAASVIAMAGDEIQMSPVSILMIHNPATTAMGDHNEMEKAIDLLEAVKDSIINAYELKTGLSKNKLSRLMEQETWMDANKALDLHFTDYIIQREEMYNTKLGQEIEELENKVESGFLFSRKLSEQAVVNKVVNHYKKVQKTDEPKSTGYQVDDCRKRLELIKEFI